MSFSRLNGSLEMMTVLFKYINVYVSFYLHLSKYIDSDHLCYIYLASFTSLQEVSPDSQYLFHKYYHSSLCLVANTIEFHFFVTDNFYRNW